MKAREIMTANPVTVSPQTPVAEVAALLLKKRISAVPVVGADGKIAGIVSEGDLMRRTEAGTQPRHSWWLDLIASEEFRAAEYVKTHGRTAADVMTRNVVSVEPDASAGDVAELLERRHIKRVPVVKGGKVVGIVSRADLIRGLATFKHKIASGTSQSEAQIREKVLSDIGKEGVANESWINPIVAGSVVNLWGIVETAQQRDAVKLIASSVDGVKSVVDHLAILSDLTRSVMWAE